MPVHMHVAGTVDYRFTRRSITFQDVYDLGDALSQCQTLGTGGTGAIRDFVQGEVEGAVAPPDARQEAMNAAGRMIGVRMIGIGIMAVRTTPSVLPLQITLSARQSNTMWVDTSRIAYHTIYSDDMNPTRDFLRSIHSTLEDTGLNGFSVLTALGHMFSDYALRGSQPSYGDAQMLIQLSH